MKQLTIRFGVELERSIREVSRQEGVSLNQAAVRLMRKGAGLSERAEAASVGASLDHLMGTWSVEEEKQFLSSLHPLERIDESFWS